MSISTPGDCARSLVADVLRSHGKVRLRVAGSSMLPTLWPGDFLSFESAPAQPIRPGMIVLVQLDDRFVIHRVMRCEGNEFVTRGDAMVQSDTPARRSDILGSLTCISRGSKTLTATSKISGRQRVLGWLLCRCSLLHRLALRWHSERASGWAAEARNIAG